jgi:hypothetical protein
VNDVKLPFKIGIENKFANASNTTSTSPQHTLDFTYTVLGGDNGSVTSITSQNPPLTLTSGATIKDNAGNDLSGATPAITGGKNVDATKITLFGLRTYSSSFPIPIIGPAAASPAPRDKIYLEFEDDTNTKVNISAANVVITDFTLTDNGSIKPITTVENEKDAVSGNPTGRLEITTSSRMGQGNFYFIKYVRSGDTTITDAAGNQVEDFPTPRFLDNQIGY